MNKEEIEAAIKVMQAFVNGQSIEFLVSPYNDWHETTCPVWDFSKYRYRVKPLYVDFKIDDKVLVRKPGCYSHEWKRRYFAGVNENSGKPMTWESGGTSWNTKSKISWDECKLAEEESK